jgi:hypothetical protein
MSVANCSLTTFWEVLLKSAMKLVPQFCGQGSTGRRKRLVEPQAHVTTPWPQNKTMASAA